MVGLIFFVVFILLLLIIFSFVFMLKIHIEFTVEFIDNEFKQYMSIKAFLFNKMVYKNIYNSNSQKGEFSFKKAKKGYKEYSEKIDFLVKKSKDKDVAIVINVGVIDAAKTAMICGLIWSIIGNLRRIEFINILLNNAKLEVCPNFSKKIFNLTGFCIFNIQIVYIIYAIFVFKNFLKREETSYE